MVFKNHRRRCKELTGLYKYGSIFIEIDLIEDLFIINRHVAGLELKGHEVKFIEMKRYVKTLSVPTDTEKAKFYLEKK